MDESRLVKRVYRLSKIAFLEKGVNNWCSQIHKLAFKYNLGFLWDNETLVNPPENKEAEASTKQLKVYWYRRLQENVHKKEELVWKQELDSKPKLRTYKTFKTELRLEKYLLSEQDKPARYLLTSIRTGTNQLRIEAGRRKKPKEKVEERLCVYCSARLVEDEKHFVLHCHAYQDLREEMFKSISEATHQKVTFVPNATDEHWKLLMSNNKEEKIADFFKIYVGRAFHRRKMMKPIRGG